MAELADLSLPDEGKLAENIAHFARGLRAAGLPVGPGQVLDAVRAVAAAGFTKRMDFYHALQACLVRRPEHRLVFAQLFRLFWRDPRYVEHMMAMMLPSVRGAQEERAARPAEKRAAEALLDGVEREAPELPEGAGEEIEIDASATMSAQERLAQLDFEQMSTAEMAQARRILAQMSLPVRPIKTRRSVRAAHGRIDARASLRAALRRGGEMSALVHRTPQTRWPDLVVLCDISGSMSAYSRAVLHFVHAVANRRGQGWARVHAFTFGTQLTNITRALERRDVDEALAAVGCSAQDWEGGTRIGESLAAFNRDWSRRIMGRGAVVLLVTDGLERGDAEALARAGERLHLSARQVIWLNPLLRWDGFAPKAAGIAALLPHVDSFRAGHNIASLEGLAAALADPRDGGDKARAMAMLRA